jgi:hypothetical protein
MEPRQCHRIYDELLLSVHLLDNVIGDEVAEHTTSQVDKK